MEEGGGVLEFNRKATVVCPVVDPIAQASIGSNPSKRLIPKKSPLSIKLVLKFSPTSNPAYDDESAKEEEEDGVLRLYVKLVYPFRKSMLRCSAALVSGFLISPRNSSAVSEIEERREAIPLA